MAIKYRNSKGEVFFCDSNALPDNIQDLEVIEKTDLDLSTVWYNLTKEKHVDYKVDRKKEIDTLVVTTSYGSSFDADEESQFRMNKTLSVLKVDDEINWKLADNTFKLVSYYELKEALYLAVKHQTTIWETINGN